MVTSPDINKQIVDARDKLRSLYDKYIKEFHDINLKIDKYLETLGEDNAKP